MGLDMYLEKFPRIGLKPRSINAVNNLASWIQEGREHKCSFEEWCGYDVEDLPDVPMVVKLLEMRHTTYYAWDENKEYPHQDISDQVGYWRKANTIHAWFVNNVQDGEDDCEYHRPVAKNDLETLLGLCNEVLANHDKADKLLPVTHGFFFGSYEYDEWYFKDIEKTAKMCEQLINDFDFENYDLYYCSSW